MAPEVNPQFESEDRLGTTTQYAGTATTSPVLVPSVAGGRIAELLVRCDSDNTPNTERLLWSLDNITYHKLAPGEFVGWTLKDNITQIYVKGTTAAVDYEIILNRELP